MNPHVLQKLEWPQLLADLAKHTQTEEGRDICLGLLPSMDKDQIEDIWGLTLPLRDLASKGYRAPIGALPNLHLILKAASLGQVLAGEDFRNILTVLESTKGCFNFASDFSSQCATLKKFKARI